MKSDENRQVIALEAAKMLHRHQIEAEPPLKNSVALLKRRRAGRGTGFQPVGPTGILPVVFRATAGKMPACPTAKMAVLQSLPSFLTEPSHLINGRGRVAVDFWAWVRRRRGSISVPPLRD